MVAFYGVAIFFTAWHQGAIRDLIYVPVASVLCSLVTFLAPVLSFPVDGCAREIFNRQFKYDIINPAVTLLFWMEHELDGCQDPRFLLVGRVSPDRPDAQHRKILANTARRRLRAFKSEIIKL